MIETTDFNKSEQYTLSIRLSTDGFSFCVQPSGRRRVLLLRPCSGRVLLLTANLKQTFRELAWLERPFRRVNVLMADKRFTFIPWSSSRTNKRKSFSITTILNGKTKPYNTTYCIRAALSYCSAWIRVPAPSFANSIPMSSSIPKPAPSLSSSPQRAAWATTGRCMHTCERCRRRIRLRTRTPPSCQFL